MSILHVQSLHGHVDQHVATQADLLLEAIAAGLEHLGKAVRMWHHFLQNDMGSDFQPKLYHGHGQTGLKTVHVKGSPGLDARGNNIISTATIEEYTRNNIKILIFTILG